MNLDAYPAPLEELVELLRRLPGIGRRGAERLALALYKWDPAELQKLGAAVGALPGALSPCPVCGVPGAEGEPCAVCNAPGRDDSLLCVVEEFPQLFAIERSGRFRGRYHVLGGRLSPLDRRGADDLNLESLYARLRSGPVREVILALGSDVEGRATAVYIGERLREFPVRVTRPAVGVPAGASLALADAATIGAALGARTAF